MGKLSQRDAESVLTHVRKLEAAVNTGGTPELSALLWLETINVTLHGRLAANGLCKPRVQVDAKVITVGGLVDAYLARRTDLKLNTRNTLRLCRRHLVAFFGEDRDVTAICTADAKDWRRATRGSYSEATTAKSVKLARQIWADAVERGYIKSNPFAAVRIGQMDNPGRLHFVDADRFPVHVVCAWIGNDARTARKHYLRVRDEHFSAASGVNVKPVQEVTLQPAAMPGNGRQPASPFASVFAEIPKTPTIPQDLIAPGGNRTHNAPRKNQAETSVGVTGGAQIARPAPRPRRSRRSLGQARTAHSLRTARRRACQHADAVSTLLTRESAAGERAKRCDHRPAADQHAAERSEGVSGVRHAARGNAPIRPGTFPSW